MAKEISAGVLNPDTFPVLRDMVLFRAGDYGPKGQYTVEDIQAFADSYDPLWLEAPATPDHVQDGPAWGWIQRLYRFGDELRGDVQVHPDTYKALAEGRYRRRSVEIYRALLMRDGTTKPYIKAVSFLGAATPQVKGMPNIRFSDGQDPTDYIAIDFMGDDGNHTTERTQGMKDNETFAEKLAALEQELESRKAEAAQFKAEAESAKAEAKKMGEVVTSIKSDFAATQIAFEQIRVSLFQEKEALRFSKVGDAAVMDGRLTTRQNEILGALFASLPADTETERQIDFADDGGNIQKIAPRALLLQFIESCQKVVPVGKNLMTSNFSSTSRTTLSREDDPAAFSARVAERADEIEKENPSMSYGDCVLKATQELTGRA